MKSKNEVKQVKPAEEIKEGFCLVAHSPFREYQRGSRIHDMEEINAILDCHERNMTNKVFFNYG